MVALAVECGSRARLLVTTVSPQASTEVTQAWHALCSNFCALLQASAAASEEAVLATDPQPAVNVPTHASAPHTPPATSAAPSATSQAPSATSQAPSATSQAADAASQAISATSQGHSTQLPGNAHAPSLLESHQPQAPADGQHADSIEADVPAATKLALLSEKPETAIATQRASNESASSNATSSEAAQAAAVHENPHDESCLGSSHSAADAAQPSSSSSSSARSDSDSQPSTPVSDRSVPQASAQSSQTSIGSVSQLDQQVAVLSLLAGVAADPASPLTYPQSLRSAHAESSAREHQPSSQGDVAAMVSSEEQSFPPADESSAGTSSEPASESSLDIYDALREDRGNRNDWHVVKTGRKSGLNTTKAVDKSTDLPPAPDQQQQLGMSQRGRSAESFLRSQEGGAEAGALGVSGEVGQSGKTVRRCSSGASLLSWSSAEAVEPMERYAEQYLLWYGLPHMHPSRTLERYAEYHLLGYEASGLSRTSLSRTSRPSRHQVHSYL